MNEVRTTGLEEETMEEIEEAVYYFITDNKNDITHIVIPLDYVYSALSEREETLLEIKREIKNIQWEKLKREEEIY